MAILKGLARYCNSTGKLTPTHGESALAKVLITSV